MQNRLAPGDAAPALTLPDASGTPVSLSDFPGQRVVVYFYPAAMTPGCTTQACDFTAERPAFDAEGCRVLGVSPDKPEKLAKFIDKESLAITLLSDESKDTMKAWGAFGMKKLYGKEVEGVIRSTIVVDVDNEGAGTVTLAQYNVRAKGHVSKLMRDLSFPPATP